MRAAVFAGDGRLDVRDVPAPEVSAVDDVVIRVAANAICGGDLHSLAASTYRPGITIGHEFAGTVVDAGSAASLSVGDRVAVLPNVTCGICDFCREGKLNLCLNQETFGLDQRNGGAAEFVSAPASVVYRVPDGLSLELASIAEPLGCVLNGSLKAEWHPGHAAIILGGGPIGLMFAVLALAAGANPVTVFESTVGRRAAAHDLGADVVDPADQDAVDRMRDSAHTVIDTVGGLIDEAASVVRPGGKILLFGLGGPARPLFPTRQMVFKELRVAGVFLAVQTFQLALDLLARGTPDFGGLVKDRYPLDDIETAFESMSAGEAMKALILPS